MIRFAGILRGAAVMAMLAAAVSCNVHEWPEESQREQYALKLIFDTEFTEWSHTYDGSNLAATGRTPGIGSECEKGYMHCIVRAYPKTGGEVMQRAYDGAQQPNCEEFEFTRSIAQGYNCELRVKLAPGDYTVMVWSELSETADGRHYYDAADFGDIRLTAPHAANTPYRDAFRGTADITVKSYANSHIPDNTLVMMERPLAKYEFVLSGLQEFLTKNGGTIDDYEAAVTYTAYMPCSYSMFIDKPVDSSTGVAYVGDIRRLSNAEASLGFDYVFVNGTESAVTVQVEVRRKSDAEAVSRSKTIRVPLRRGEHTLIRGSFLTLSPGGVGVDPGYDGDYNITIE